tara:strand:- start:200 stop:352 length:153 start_codon:yes stop_codon:yes gene_type:complete
MKYLTRRKKGYDNPKKLQGVSDPRETYRSPTVNGKPFSCKMGENNYTRRS